MTSLNLRKDKINLPRQQSQLRRYELANHLYLIPTTRLCSHPPDISINNGGKFQLGVFWELACIQDMEHESGTWESSLFGISYKCLGSDSFLKEEATMVPSCAYLCVLPVTVEKEIQRDRNVSASPEVHPCYRPLKP